MGLNLMSMENSILTRLHEMIDAGKKAEDFLTMAHEEAAERREKLEKVKMQMITDSMLQQNTTAEGAPDSCLSAVIKLNVGGKNIDLKRSTVVQVRSRLAWILSGRWDHVLPKDRDGRLFFDYDPEWFEPIINHLRDLGLQDPHKPIPGPPVATEHQYAFHFLVQYFGLEPTFDIEACRAQKPQKLIHLDTQILTDPFMVESLHQFCPNHLKPNGLPELELIYRGSRDGFTAAAFHRHCDGKPNTFTIVRDSAGSIFGGFADIPWGSGRRFESSRASFLFALSLHGARNPLAVRQCAIARNPAHSLYHHDLHLAVFGGGHDLHIAEGCNNHSNNTLCLGYTYQNYGFPQLFTGGSAHFRVDELEVFAVRGPALGASALSEQQPEPDLTRAFEAHFERLGLGERFAPVMEQARALDAHAHALMVQGLHLHALQAEVERDENDLAAEIDFMARLYPDATRASNRTMARADAGTANVLRFNAGGAMMCVSRETLRGAPESMLYTQYCSDRWGPPLPRDLDGDGAIFLDVNPYCFARIVSRLRLAALAAARKEAFGGLPAPAMDTGIDSMWEPATVAAAPGNGPTNSMPDAVAVAEAAAEAEAAGARRLFFRTLDPAHRASLDRMLGYFQLHNSSLFRYLDTHIEEVRCHCG
jgi:hypothetical protein